MPASRRSAYFAWIVVCLVWGTTYLAIRIALESIPPFLMAGFRWTIAGSLILAVLVARGERVPPPREWPSLAVIGGLMMGFGNGFVVWAEQTIPSGLAAVLVAAIPFWMVSVEKLLGSGERLSTRRVIGLIIGFAGIVLLVWPEITVTGGRPFLYGVVATQLACFGWAIGSSYSRRRGSHENVLMAAAMQMLLGGLCILPFAVLRGEWASLVFVPRTTGALVYLIVAGSLIGFSAYAYALKHLPVSTVSLYAYVNPIIAVLLGTLVLGEPLSPRLAAAGAVVLVGMGMVRQP